MAKQVITIIIEETNNNGVEGVSFDCHVQAEHEQGAISEKVANNFNSNFQNIMNFCLSNSESSINKHIH